MEEVYDEVLVPALNYVKRDFAFGKLEEGNQQFVFEATRNILEELDSLKPKTATNPTASTETGTIDAYHSAANVRIL